MNDSINNKVLYNYNKTITMDPITKAKFQDEEEKSFFDLCFFVYNGKLTTIIDEFNKRGN